MIKWRPIWCSALALCLGLTGFSGASATTRPRAGLTGRDIQRIVRMTGYHGLRSHHFVLAETLEAGQTRTLIVRLDRARPGVPLREIRRDLHLADSLAAKRPAFTIGLRLGAGPKHRVGYDVAPADVLEPSQRYIRYVIFSPRDEQLSMLTRPQRVPPIQALTVIDAYDRLNVTLLHDGSRAAKWGPGVSAASLYAMVECLNTASYVYVPPRTLDRRTRHHVTANRLVALGREVWSNSLGFATVAARDGTPYRRYAHEVARIRFGIYQQYDLRYLAVPAAEYRQLRRA